MTSQLCLFAKKQTLADRVYNSFITSCFNFFCRYLRYSALVSEYRLPTRTDRRTGSSLLVGLGAGGKVAWPENMVQFQELTRQFQRIAH
jgi:hypothetical protein